MPAATPPYYSNWGNYTGGSRLLVVTLPALVAPVAPAATKAIKAQHANMATDLEDWSCLELMHTGLHAYSPACIQPCMHQRHLAMARQSRNRVTDLL